MFFNPKFTIRLSFWHHFIITSFHTILYYYHHLLHLFLLVTQSLLGHAHGVLHHHLLAWSVHHSSTFSFIQGASPLKTPMIGASPQTPSLLEKETKPFGDACSRLLFSWNVLHLLLTKEAKQHLGEFFFFIKKKQKAVVIVIASSSLWWMASPFEMMKLHR